MLDVVPEANQNKEFTSHMEEIKVINIERGEILRNIERKHALKRKYLHTMTRQTTTTRASVGSSRIA